MSKRTIAPNYLKRLKPGTVVCFKSENSGFVVMHDGTFCPCCFYDVGVFGYSRHLNRCAPFRFGKEWKKKTTRKWRNERKMQRKRAPRYLTLADLARYDRIIREMEK